MSERFSPGRGLESAAVRKIADHREHLFEEYRIRTKSCPEDLDQDKRKLLADLESQFQGENMSLDEGRKLTPEQRRRISENIFYSNIEWFYKLSALLGGISWCIIVNHKVIQWGSIYALRPHALERARLAEKYNTEPIYICPTDFLPNEADGGGSGMK